MQEAENILNDDEMGEMEPGNELKDHADVLREAGNVLQEERIRSQDWILTVIIISNYLSERWGIFHILCKWNFHLKDFNKGKLTKALVHLEDKAMLESNLSAR